MLSTQQFADMGALLKVSMALKVILIYLNIHAVYKNKLKGS